MKTSLISIFAAAAVALTTANALPTNITVDASGNYLQNGFDPPALAELSLASVAFYQAAAGLSSGNSNDRETNFDFLTTVVGNWNSNNGGADDLPAAVLGSTPAADNGSIGGTNSFIAPSGFRYVVFHFGAGEAGGGSDKDETGWWSAWYLGGAGATFSLPQEGSPLENVGGFSSARFFNPTTSVPDGGLTIALLGLTLLGLGAIRCKVGKIG